MNIRGFLVVLIALTMIAACGTAETPTAFPIPAETAVPTRRPLVVPTTPAGWTPYSRSTYQIALPDTWQEVKLSEAEIKSAIAASQESNPPLAEQLRALLESGQATSFTFYAVDKQDKASMRNVSIARVALERTNDLANYAKAYAEALPNAVRGSKVIEVQAPLQVNGIDAASIQYEVSLVDNAGTLATLRGLQFLYRLDSGDTFLVTVTGSAEEANSFLPLARQIATSFVGTAP